MDTFMKDMDVHTSNLRKLLTSTPIPYTAVLSCVKDISRCLQKDKLGSASVRAHAVDIIEGVFSELFPTNQEIPNLFRPVLYATIDSGLSLSARFCILISSFCSGNSWDHILKPAKDLAAKQAAAAGVELDVVIAQVSQVATELVEHATATVEPAKVAVEQVKVAVEQVKLSAEQAVEQVVEQVVEDAEPVLVLRVESLPPVKVEELE